jgi:hypothetical protein
MKIFAGIVHICLLAVTMPLIHAQEGKIGEEKPPIKGEIKSLDLCALASVVSLTKDEATKRHLGWMEVETQNHGTKGLPAHVDIHLSYEAKQKVRLFCGVKGGTVRIDSFDRVKGGASCPASFVSGTPNPPVPPPIPTLRKPQITLGPPKPHSDVQHCYKFSFTVWNPGVKHVDPHLIIDP